MRMLRGGRHVSQRGLHAVGWSVYYPGTRSLRGYEVFELLLPLNPALSYGLPLLGALCFLAVGLLGTRLPFVKGLASGFLVGGALLSLCFYAGLHLSRGEYLNAYEFYHYYLGSKYAPELGYGNLYNATVVAQVELGHTPLPSRVRSLETGRMIPVAGVLAEKEIYRDAFSPVRWENFKGDVDFFWQRFESKALWQRMLQDKGYNPPPIWTMIGGSLANAVPVENLRAMMALASLDGLLMLAAALAVWWAFGHHGALLLIILVYSHYLNSHFTLKAAFLRLDWLAALILALCAMKKERPGLAGGLTAFAAGVRVFPVFFAFGPLLLFLGRYVWKRQWDSEYRPFVYHFFQTGAILFVASLLYSGGYQVWLEFWDKIIRHSGDLSGWRMGLKYVFLWSADGAPVSGLRAAEHLETYKLYYRLLQGALLALWVAALVNQRKEHVYALGLLPFFILTDATYYYYVVVALPFLYFLTPAPRAWAMIGVLALFAMSAAGHWLFSEYDRGYITFFYLSLMMLAICLWMALGAGIRAWQYGRGAEKAPHPQ